MRPLDVDLSSAAFPFGSRLTVDFDTAVTSAKLGNIASFLPRMSR